MANWTTLKAAIADVIKTNGNQEITGAVLQNTLNSIVNAVGENATFVGIATPRTSPGTPDGPVFYLAAEQGVYSNFNGIEISDELALIKNNSSGSWIKVNTGAALKKELDSNLMYYGDNFSIIGKFINSNGSESTDVSRPFCVTPYLYIEKATSIIIKNAFYNKYVSVIAFYDKNKAYISSFGEQEAEGKISLNLTSDDIPENAVYARVTSYTTYDNRIVKIGLLSSIFEANKTAIEANKTAIEANKTAIEGAPDHNEDLSNKQWPWTPGFVALSGALNSYSGGENYMRTSYINIEGIRTIHIRHGYKNQYLSIVAFYNKDKVFISAPLNDGTESTNINDDITVPENAVYAAFTTRQKTLSYFYFNFSLPIAIAANKADIAANKADIAANKADIAANKADIAANKADIANGITWNINFGDYKSKLTESGWIKSDGIVYNDASWVHGIIELPEELSYITVHFGTNSVHNSVNMFFTNGENSIIAGSNHNQNKSDITLEIPSGAKGFLVSVKRAEINDFYVYSSKDWDPKKLKNRIKSIEADIADIKNVNNFICCPDKFYAVIGQEFNLYYDSLIKGLDAGLLSPFGIYVDIQCPDLQNASNQIGVRRERMWQIAGNKLTDAYIGEHSLQITAYNSEGKQIDQKTATLVVSDSISLSDQKYILCIGDSLTNNGPIVSTCAQHFSDIGGTQPIFIGQRTTSGYKHEGYPGYTFGSFVSSTAGYTYRIFDIPAGTSVSIGDKYETNGTQYVIKDIRTEGLDNALRLRCERSSGTNEPTETGTLTKISGASSSALSIEYSAYEAESGNPFWDSDTGADNFTKYREKMGMGDNKFDIVVIMLGTNDCIGNIKSSMQGSVNNAITLINAILEDAGEYPTKILLQMTPPDANTISSWQVYNDGLGSGKKIGYWTNLWNLRKLLYDEFTKENWVGKVILGQASLGVDRYYGFPYSEVVSSSRISAINEIYHTNSVHPNTQGYQQLGDGYYLQIKGIL